MSDNKRVMIHLSNQVRVYGTLNMLAFLVAAFEDFQRLDQYPPNIKPPKELAEEVHNYLETNKIYDMIAEGVQSYALHIGYSVKAPHLAFYPLGDGGVAITPQAPWIIITGRKNEPPHLLGFPVTEGESNART